MSYPVKSFLNGPSFRSLAASVRARNLLNPVVAAPLPSAAALASTSSLEVIIAAETGFAITGATEGVEAAGATEGEGPTTVGLVIPDPRLLKSSNILC